MQRRTFLKAAAGAALVSAPFVTRTAHAKLTQPVSLVVPFGAGGSTDVSARALAKLAEPLLGQSIVVVNRPGAGGAIALGEVKRAKPDGHTLAVYTAGGATVTPFLQPVPYEVDDFRPLINYGLFTTYMVVPADSPYKTLDDLFDYIRDNPDRLALATTTIGSVGHLGTARMLLERDLKAEFVAFGGGAQIIPALLGGHVQVATLAGEVLPYLKSGQLRVLVSFTVEQLPELSDVPSLDRYGFQWELDSWLGLATPAGVPDAVFSQLENAFLTAARDPAFQRSMDSLATVLSVRDSRLFEETVAKSYRENGDVIQRLGLASQAK